MPDSMIKIETALLEAAVLSLAAEPGGIDLSRYHAERELLYCEAGQASAGKDWERFHERWFQRFGMLAQITEAIGEQGLLRDAIPVRVLLANRGKEEGAELFEEPASRFGLEGRRSLILRVRSDRFLNPARLRLVMRIDLQHVADMLDKEFFYDRSALDELEPARRSLVMDRTMLLWGISVRARIRQRFAEPCLDESLAQLNLMRAFRSWSPLEVDRQFGILTRGPRPTFPWIVEQALGLDSRAALAAAERSSP